MKNIWLAALQREKIIALTFLIITISFGNIIAQNLPLVYDIENTCPGCPTPNTPPFNELPNIPQLPNPFTWEDGRGQVQYFSDWKYRRAEIGTLVQHYGVGPKPGQPENMTASYENGTLTVRITENGNTLTLTSAITLPEGEGPFPLLIGIGGATGSLPADIFTSRDIARMSFNFGQVMAHTQTRGLEPINQLYPDLYHMGAYSAWPWGISRLIDGLEMVADELNINFERIAVTGCSFAGKMALFSGAFDERIALTISQESGGGGYTAWRVNQVLTGVERISNTNRGWFADNLFQFGNAVSRLPFDHHQVMAMVAPRALLVIGNQDYVWMADESGYVASRAAETVYDALGIPDRFGYTIAGGHGHCALPESRRPAVEAFVDKFMLGIEDANTNVAISPYNTDLSPWVNWETPVLTEGESFMDRARLVSPEDQETELDTEVTFQWDVIDQAKTYRLQVSKNTSFSQPVEIFTEATQVTIDELEKGVRYYWRVQVENNEGVLGPWTTTQSFVTAIPIPARPQTRNLITQRNRTDFITLNWNRVPYATSYFVNFTETAGFEGVVRTSTVSDSAATIYSVFEGRTYYWRVRAQNLSGNSDWSEAASFTLILGPTDLSVAQTGSGEVTLSWTDNSSVESGYIIERKTGADGIFAPIDTVVQNATGYVDRHITGDLLVYRVRAFLNEASSNFSNEALITDVSIPGDQSDGPSGYYLNQNFPNPFNPATVITFGVPEASQIQLEVYNMLGQKIDTLFDGWVRAGSHTVQFDASSLSSGIYVYKLRAGDFTQTRKLSLVK